LLMEGSGSLRIVTDPDPESLKSYRFYGSGTLMSGMRKTA
jgi:hypothetical protein